MEPRIETLNVAGDGGYAVSEIVQAIKRSCARPIREIWLSAWLMKLIASGNEVAARSVGLPCVFDRDAVRALTEDSVIDASSLRQRVGGLGSMTPLDVGISRMLADAAADRPAGAISHGVR